MKPLHVVVESLPDKPPNECFLIVPEHVIRYGGEQLIGWAIWEWKKVLLEAEFHTIWQSPDRSLIDLTPKDFPVSRILFLPDPSREYTGIMVESIRRPLKKDARILRFCELWHERFLELNKGDLAHQYGKITNPDVVARVGEIDDEITQLEYALVQSYGHR
jgi:hypothetical protein